MMNGEPAPLTPNKLIGGAVVLYLKNYLRDHASDQGTARFILNQMKPEHVAAIAQSILSDQDLAAIVEIKLPIHFVQGHELPVSILTDKRATHFRNIEISKPILLLANTGDDEEQSID